MSSEFKFLSDYALPLPREGIELNVENFPFCAWCVDSFFHAVSRFMKMSDLHLLDFSITFSLTSTYKRATFC